MSNIQANALEPNSSQIIENLAPIAISERIDAMDILRGLALVGILLMNIEWFNRALISLGSQDTHLTGLDHAIGWLIRCFVEGKFYKLFALLFGMGFAVMLIRAKVANRPFSVWFSRRMLVLIVIGLLHMVFLWGGDILHDYGFAGLLLLGWVTLLKKPEFMPYDNPKSFFKLAVVWLCVPILLAVLAGIGFGLSYDTQELTLQWQQQIKVAKRVEAINLAHASLAQQKNELLTETTAARLVTVASKIPVMNANEHTVVDLDTQQSSLPSASFELSTPNPTTIKPTIDSTEGIKVVLKLSAQAAIELEAQKIVAQQRAMQVAVLAENKAFTKDNYWQATEFRLNFTLFVLTFTLPFAFTTGQSH
ncbi:MAG: hypothetical protein ACJASU_000993 [Cognaticolwellia sp.]|jgi:hypothetical protein